MPGADPREALIAAATRAFAEHGPRNVSVRQLATAAGVNHGLVHYYFGSKDGLLRAVLDRSAEGVAAELAAVEDLRALYTPGGAAERHARILAYVMLEARDPRDVQTDFPTVHALVDRLVAAGLDPAVARQRAAEVTAFVLGWQFFGPFLQAATADDEQEPGAPAPEVDLNRAVAALLSRPVAAMPPDAKLVGWAGRHRLE